MPALYLAFGHGRRPARGRGGRGGEAASRLAGNGEWSATPAAAGAHGSVPVHADPGAMRRNLSPDQARLSGPA